MRSKSTRSSSDRASRPLATLLALGVVAGGFGSPANAANKEYVRCVDGDGVTYLGDSPPAGCADKALEKLNDQGVIKKTIPRVLTPEEQEQQALEDEREAARQKLAQRQAEYRENLFRSYATIEDLEAYHRSRMNALYYHQSRNDNQVRELRRTLRELMDEAREFNFPYTPDSDLPPVPKDLVVLLTATNEALGERQLDAENLRRKLLEQERKFESDLAIYRQYNSAESVAQGRAGGADRR